MYSTFERYSSGFGARFGKGFLRKLVKLVVLTLILYLIISSMFLATFQVESVSMMPFLEPKDRIFVSPLAYGAKFLFFSTRLPAVREPARGDVVVIRSPMYTEPKLPLSILESFLRFFSFQRGTAVRDVSGRRIPAYMIKRIVAIPGDTIKMSEFKVYIKPGGSNTYTEEQEMIPQTYSTIITGLPEGWAKEFPFSGELPPVTLEEKQYFLLGDNRQASSDSRSWGPLPRDQLLGKVIYRYWPLSRSGKL